MLAGFHQPVRRSRSRSEKPPKGERPQYLYPNRPNLFRGTRRSPRPSEPAECRKRGPGRACPITSSARARSSGGSLRPRDFAVIRLMTRSHLVGCFGRIRPEQILVYKIARAPEQFRVAWPTSRYDVIPLTVHRPCLQLALPQGGAFERVVLLSSMLGIRAPTVKSSADQWARLFMPRILVPLALDIHAFDYLPVAPLRHRLTGRNKRDPCRSSRPDGCGDFLQKAGAADEGQPSGSRRWTARIQAVAERLGLVVFSAV